MKKEKNPQKLYLLKEKTEKSIEMKNTYVFITRMVISLIVASIISMIFFNGLHPLKTPALAAGLLFFAYIFESSKNKE